MPKAGEDLRQGPCALDGLDLDVPEATVLGVLGPNTAGKTTTVRILTTLLRPDSGSARVAGVDVLARPEQVRPLTGSAVSTAPSTST
jgi:ABC-2 type transport system ATP-binding protein